MAEITKQDALRWLDMQRDAINTEIAYAAPDDKRQYFGNLKVVNWLVDRLNEMTAVEYLEIKHKICVHYIEHAKTRVCAGCPLDGVDHTNYTCGWLANNYPRRAVEIVERWKEGQDES